MRSDEGAVDGLTSGRTQKTHAVVRFVPIGDASDIMLC